MKPPKPRLSVPWLALVVFTFCSCNERGEKRLFWDGGSGASAPLGTWVSAPGYELRAISVHACAGPDAGAAGAARRRIAVEVEITATGPSRVPVNSFYARLVDGEGREQPALVRGCEPALRRTPLRALETARGLWTFELSSQPRRLDLVYRPRPLDPAVDTTVRIAVGRP